jgi:hypothetical protein
MKRTILNLIAAATLLFGLTALAADEVVKKTQPAAAQPASATPATLTTVEKTQPPQKHSKLLKRAKAKQGRAHDLDLRHCLELPTNAEIAKCAGE